MSYVVRTEINGREHLWNHKYRMWDNDTMASISRLSDYLYHNTQSIYLDMRTARQDTYSFEKYNGVIER